MLNKNLIAIIISTTLLQGCVAAALVGVVGGASVATDKRSFGNLIDDQSIELKAHSLLSEISALDDNTNIQVVSVNGSVLVVGQAKNSYVRDIAIKAVSNVKGIVQLHNQLRIGNLISLPTKTNDLWLTSKVKTALFSQEKSHATNIKVVTENGEVFLLGLVNKDRAKQAIDIARNVGGVNRVYNIFEYQEK
jgi:osmotically-inducible protein OsmY